jgi:hypothetical protein
VSTLTVILSLPWRACTNAARSGAPSGPVTVPDMLAAWAGGDHGRGDDDRCQRRRDRADE